MPMPEKLFPAANLRERLNALLRGRGRFGRDAPNFQTESYLLTMRRSQVVNMYKLTKRVIVLLTQLSFTTLIVLTGKWQTGKHCLDKQIKKSRASVVKGNPEKNKREWQNEPYFCVLSFNSLGYVKSKYLMNPEISRCLLSKHIFQWLFLIRLWEYSRKLMKFIQTDN